MEHNYSVSGVYSLRLRSSHQRCSMKKGILKNFPKFTGKHLRQNLFFNKVAGLRPASLLKKRLFHRCFHVNFAKTFKNIFFTKHLRTTASDGFLNWHIYMNQESTLIILWLACSYRFLHHFLSNNELLK